MHVDIKVTTWQRIHLPDDATQADLQTIIESMQESPMGNDLFDKWDCELETLHEAESPYMENGKPVFEVWGNDDEGLLFMSDLDIPKKNLNDTPNH